MREHVREEESEREGENHLGRRQSIALKREELGAR